MCVLNSSLQGQVGGQGEGSGEPAPGRSWFSRLGRSPKKNTSAKRFRSSSRGPYVAKVTDQYVRGACFVRQAVVCHDLQGTSLLPFRCNNLQERFLARFLARSKNRVGTTGQRAERRSGREKTCDG